MPMFNQGTVLLLSQEMISLQSNVKLRAVQNTNVVLFMVRCLQTSVVSRELSLLFLVHFHIHILHSSLPLQLNKLGGSMIQIQNIKSSLHQML